MTRAFAYRRYTLPFRTPMRTAHGVWTQREGLLVRLETGDGKITFGECAPLPWFGTETVDEAAAACAALGARVDDGQIEAIGAKYPCLGFALESAMGRAKPPAEPSPHATAQPEASSCLPVAALLPAGRAALEKIPALAGAGFRTFKWKVGASRSSRPSDAADEIALLDDVLGALPPGALLRLDANGAWTRRIAERWLARCADYREHIEFVEQPVACAARDARDAKDPSDASDARDARGGEDLLLGLAGDYPTPLALDESVATENGARRWLQLGWPGVFVIKPSLLGDADGTLAQLPPGRTVFSSALETAVGAQAALRAAFLFYAQSKIPNPQSKIPMALGFGVYPLFEDTRFDAPPAAPFVRATDLDKINPEATWNALD